ncbi:MAG: DUF6345 domain-containing protein [Siphonobacter sp.]
MKITRVDLPGPLILKDTTKLNIGGSDDIYGANSIQIFPQFVDASGHYTANLSQTHADAQGFLDWLGTWHRGNFWKKDGNVQVWEYEEPYDHWQGTYGLDAVLIAYHSGHGGMDGNGVYSIPLGGTWSGRNWANSSAMQLGNQVNRYLFWSTCQSLKVPDVTDVNPGRLAPWSTWGSPKTQGVRMIFGFQSNSYDDPNYGKNFGNNYNAGQSFRDAWINASWAISRHQIATIAATGSTRDEALNRLAQERKFEWGATSQNWWAWSWTTGYQFPLAAIAKPPILEKSEQVVFGGTILDEKQLSALAEQLGFTKKEAGQMGLLRDGSFWVSGKKQRLVVDSEGRLQGTLAESNLNNQVALSPDKALNIAQKFIKDHNFEKEGIQLKTDGMRQNVVQTGSPNGSGMLNTPIVTDTTVLFRQTVNNRTAINANHGLVMITIDNDGKVTQIHNSTKPVQDLRKGQITPGSEEVTPAQLDQQFKSVLEQKSGLSINGNTSLIDSVSGYDFSGLYTADLVNSREYEVKVNDQISKRYKVRIPV